MKHRPVSKKFIALMELKLQKGREAGKVGWDRYWKDTYFPTNEPIHDLLDHLNQEVLELAIAIHTGKATDIAKEAADVANLSMMIADYCGELEA